MSTKHIPISSIVGMNANAMSAGGDSVGGATDGGGGNSADAAAARRSAAAAAKSAEQAASDASQASGAASTATTAAQAAEMYANETAVDAQNAAQSAQNAAQSAENAATVVGSLAEPDGASRVGFTQAGAGAVVRTTLNKAREIVTPEDFGAVGDGATNDAAAFQRAANYLHTIGGGILSLTAKSYRLGQFSGSDVGGACCHQSIAPAAVSKLIVLPSNTSIEGRAGRVKIILEGGSSSPFGYSTAANFLFFPGEEITTGVLLANNLTRSVVVADTTGWSAGSVVSLARRGGETAGVANTPSQERAPLQFVTIQSVSGGVVTFAEDFIHNFESVTGLLELKRPQSIPAYYRDCYVKNVDFVRANPAVRCYVLISRVIGSGLDNVGFDGVGISFGACQTVRCGHFDFTARDSNNWVTVESCSDVVIPSFSGYGNGNAGPLGPLFFSDNCRGVRIGAYYAERFTRTGFCGLYSLDAIIDSMVLNGCGADSDHLSFDGALTLGMPATGVYPSRAVADADLYKLRNHSGNSKVWIKKLEIFGRPRVAVRAHDIDLRVDEAVVDHAPSAANVGAFHVGRSGARRADPTYYPNGGELKLTVGHLALISYTLTPLVFSAQNGFNGLFKAAAARTTTDSATGATTIQIDSPNQIFRSLPIRFIDYASNSPQSLGRTVSAVSGNTLTVSPALTSALPAGSPVWLAGTGAPNAGEQITFKSVTINGAQNQVVQPGSILSPDLTGPSAPYAATVTEPVPSPGEWQLDVSFATSDGAHYARASYFVVYDPANVSFPLNAITLLTTTQVRANASITSASIAAGIVSVLLSGSAAGKNTQLVTRWTALRAVPTRMT